MWPAPPRRRVWRDGTFSSSAHASRDADGLAREWGVIASLVPWMLDVRLSSGAGALGLLLAVSALSFLAPNAWADTHDAVLAESLYAEGKQLFERKDYAAACPKLAESDHLDPAGGTVLMLAECYEGQGKIASASVAYGEAISRAQRDRRPDREKEARTRLALFEAKVPRVVIEVPDEVRRLQGLSVKRDGIEVPTVSYGVEVFSDPGSIEISAAAPGFLPFRTTLEVRPSETQRVRIGPLARAIEKAPVEVPPPAPPSRPLSVAVPVSITLGVVGVASLAVGGYFGGVAIHDAHQVDDRCHGASTCSDRGAVDLAHTANREANAANALIPIGAASLVSGLVVILVMGPRKAPPQAARLGLDVAGAPGLSFSGAF